MRISQVKRSEGRSAVAAAAYRSGTCLVDTRTGKTHDYRRKPDIEHTEIMLPPDAPAWVQGISREALWNAVEAGEKRKDAQTCRDLRITIPRELNQPDRIALVRDFVAQNYVARGMIADIAFHCPRDSSGQIQPHAHVLLTMRPILASGGWGKKSRHDWVPDPEGRTHADGRLVMVESNPDSWNSAAFYETTRERWEEAANVALARIGSSERIDRRSLLERGLSRLPEPALRLAHHLKDLRGVLKQRFGQWQYAKFYQAVEQRATDAFAKLDSPPAASAAERVRAVARFHDWFDRQIERLAPTPTRDAPVPVRSPTPDLER